MKMKDTAMEELSLNIKYQNIHLIISMFFGMITAVFVVIGINVSTHYLFQLVFKEELGQVTLMMDIPLGILWGFICGVGYYKRIGGKRK